jgi:hypothetical protein
VKNPTKEVTMVYTSVLSRQSWLFNQFKYLGEVRDFLSINKSVHRNAGFEGAYRVLMSYKDQLVTDNLPVGIFQPEIWRDVTGIKEIPPPERLEKWLEVLLPPVVKPIQDRNKNIVELVVSAVPLVKIKKPRVSKKLHL